MLSDFMVVFLKASQFNSVIVDVGLSDIATTEVEKRFERFYDSSLPLGYIATAIHPDFYVQ